MLKRNSLVILLAMLLSLANSNHALSAQGDIISHFRINNTLSDGRVPTTIQGIAFHNGYLWAVDFGTDRIYRVHTKQVLDGDGNVLFEPGDSDFNIPVVDNGTPIPTGGGLVSAKNFLWNASPVTDDIIKIDPVDGDNMESENPFAALTYPAPTDIAYDGTNFWISDWQTNIIEKVRAEDGASLATINGPTPDSEVWGLTWDGLALWTSDRNSNMLYRMSPTDGSLLAQINPSAIDTPAVGNPPIQSLHGIAWDGDTLWLVDYRTGAGEAEIIYQIDSGIIPIGLTGCVQKNNTGLQSEVVLDQTATPSQSMTTDSDGCFHFPSFRSGVPMQVTLSETGLDEKPFISLASQNGSPDIYLEVGETFVNPPGDTATDPEDGDITPLMTAVPDVLNTPSLINTSAVNMTGTLITYNVIDSAGNNADPQTRMVYITPIAYSIGGSVSGLASGRSVVLSNNGSETITRTANGTFTFATEVPEGQPYNVTVTTQPVGQSCSVVNGNGTANENVTTVQVTCVDLTFNLSVNATGLTSGDTLTVANNSTNLAITANGTHLLQNVTYNSAYNITIVTPPANKTCSFANGSVTSGNALSDVTVSVQCQYITYTLGGTVTGLDVGDTPSLRLENSSQLTTVTTNGSFTLSGTINSGSTYLVLINQKPTTKNCTITNNTGTATANVTSINVDCLDNIPPETPTVNTQITNNPSPVISGGANPLVGDVLSVSLNGATYDSVPVTAGSWSVNTATTTPSSGSLLPLTTGSYDITATMVDGAGNSSSDLTSNELTIDLVLPATPTVNSIITNASIPGPLTGTATLNAGETLRVSVNGATYNNVGVSAGGWSVNLASTTPSSGTLGAFANGTSYNVTATVADTAGNSVPDGTTNEVVIDRTAPVAPATPDMTTATDTGVSSTDNNTVNTRPDFTGTCTATERITLFIDGTNTGASQVCSSGSYTISAPNILTNGVHTVAVTATDLAGNQSVVSATPLSVTIDTVAPVAPTITNLITNNTRPTLTGTATLVAGETLEITINTAVYSNVPVTAGTWTLNTATATPSSGTFNPLSNGSYNISAVSMDLAGNIANDSTTNELTIDTIAPTAPTVNVITTNDTTPNITGLATLLAGETLSITVNGATYNNVPTNTGIWNINTGLVTPSSGTLAAFVNGNSYDVVARITDAAGNSSVDVTTNEVIIDTTPPTTPTVNTLVTNDVTPTISGTASVGAGESLAVVFNGATYNNVSVTAGLWQIDTGAVTPTSGVLGTLTNGTSYNVVATVTDTARLTTTDVTNNEITYDITPPAAPATPDLAPASDSGRLNNDNVTNITSLTFIGACTTNETMRLFVDATATAATTVCSGGTYTLATPSPLAVGTRNVTITATDIAGNASAQSAGLAVIVDTTAPVAPATPDMTTATDTGTSNTDNNTSNTRPDFTGVCTATDFITLFIDGISTSATQICTTGTYTITTPNALTNGVHTVAVAATDLAGNQGSVSTTPLSITIDTVDLVAPTVNSLITSNTRPTLTGTATLSAGESLEITINAVVYSNVPVTAGAWSLNTLSATPSSGTFTPLSNGSYNVSAVSRDLAGNTASDSTTNELTIDTVAPTAPTVTVMTTNDTTPNITGSATLLPGETLSITVNGATYNNVPTNTGIWSINTGLVTPSSGALAAFVNGNSYDVVARITDAAGNSTVDVSTNEINIDTTPPTTPTVNTLVTNDITPTISGTASVSAGESLAVIFNGATYNNVPVTAGAWQIDTGVVSPSTGTLGAFTNGTSYNVVATVTDTARLTTTDVTNNEITIDLTPPAAPAAPDLTPASDLGRLNNDNVTNITTLTFSGICTTNETIRLYVDAVATAATTICSGGTYTLTTPSPLNVGTRNVSITTRDIAGNESAQSTALTVTIDTTGPVAPGVPDLTAATDTGSSSTDNITGSFNPQFTGTCVNGETVAIFVNGTNTNDTQVCAGGLYTVTLTTSLTNGSYPISARATDLAGNDGALSSELTIIIDTSASAPPAVPDMTAVTDSGLSSTDNITSDTTPTFSGACVSGDTIALYINGTASGNTAVCAAATYNITLSTALANGSHGVSATATGTTGVESPLSTPLSVIIDTVSPLVPAATDLTVGSDSGSSGTDNITSVTMPIFAGTCNADETITLFIDGVSSGASMACSSGNYSITTPSDLSTGARVITVTATDVAGNQSTQSSALNVQIDNVAPVALASPTLNAANDSGISNSDRITSVTTLQISGSCVSGDSVALLINGTSVGVSASCAASTYSLSNPTPFSSGVYNLSATATDVAGNTGTASPALAVTVDTVAPEVPAVTPLLTRDTTPIVSGTATLLAGETLAVSINGSTYNNVVVTAGAWSVNTETAPVSSGPAFSPLADGSYSITARVVDLAGNAANDASANELTIDTTAPAAPAAPDLLAASDTGTSSTDNITRTTTPTFTGACANGEVVRLYVNGIVTTASTVCASSVYSLVTPTALSNGNQSVSVTTTDTSGNESIQSAALSVIIDTAAPITPTVTTQTTNDTTPMVSGTASLSAGDSLAVTVNGATFNNVVVSAGSWSLDLGSATPSVGTLGVFVDATYSVVAIVTDIAGNTATDASSNELIIDTTAPTGMSAPDMVAASDSGTSDNDNITSDTTPTFAGTCVNGETIRIYVDGVANNSVVCAASAYSLTTTALTAGVRAITVTTTDTIGNESSQSPALSATIDTTAPTAPGVTDMLTSSDSGQSGTDNITNVVTPSFSAACTTSNTMTLLIDGSATTATHLCSTGTYTLTAPSALTNGSYSIAVTASDPAGNTSTASTALSITVDTSAPAQLAVTDLMTASDTGTSNTDNITTVASPSFAGSCTTGDTVSLYINGSASAASAACSAGSYVVTTASTLADGNYSISVLSTDVAGNSSATSPALAITIDNAMPATPTVNVLSTNGTAPVISGTAVLVAGDSLRVTINGATYSNVPVTAGTWVVDTSTATPTSGTLGVFIDGAYSVVATISDAAGNNISDISSNEVIIDTTPPPVLAAPDLVTASDSGASNIDDLTRITTPTFTGSCLSGNTVRLYVDGVVNSISTACIASTYNVTPSAALTEGVRSIAVSTTDPAGNESAQSPALSVIIDVTGPTAPSTAPDLNSASDSGTSSTDNVTNVTLPVVSGTCTDGEVIRLYVDGSSTAVSATCSGSTYSLTTANALSNGAHSITVTRSDSAGNDSAQSPALAITIDTAAPAAPAPVDMSAASDTGASSTDNITSNTVPLFTGSCTTNETVRLFVDGSNSGIFATCAASAYTMSPASALANGTRNISVTATDAAGNTSAQSVALSITVDTVANQLAAPNLIDSSDTGSSNSDNTTNDTTPTFSGSCISGEFVALHVNGIANGTAATCSGNAYSITSTALASDVHSITVLNTDLAGNVSAASPALGITIDTVAPAAPTVNTLVARTTTPTLTGTATVSVGDVLNVSVNGATYNNVAVTAGSWSLNLASATPSSGALGSFADNTAYNVTATLSDAAGNAQPDASTNELTMDHLTSMTLSVTGYSSATPLVINIGGSTRSFSANGTSVVTVNYNAAYTFAVTTQPTGQACTFPASTATPRTSISGTAGADATISVVCQSTNMTFTNSTALTIPVNTSSTPITLTSTLTVANNVQISDLNLYVNMTHSWMSDVSIRLTSPAGTNVLLMERPGSSSSLSTVSSFTHVGCSSNNMSATLDDEGSATVESSCTTATPAISGTLRPNNVLSAFDGQSTAGVWTLTIYDSHPRADGGSLTSWSMNVTTSGL